MTEGQGSKVEVPFCAWEFAAAARELFSVALVLALVVTVVVKLVPSEATAPGIMRKLLTAEAIKQQKASERAMVMQQRVVARTRDKVLTIVAACHEQAAHRLYIRRS